jgi:plasmid maintenance system antidote protein VapI
MKKVTVEELARKLMHEAAKRQAKRSILSCDAVMGVTVVRDVFGNCIRRVGDPERVRSPPPPGDFFLLWDLIGSIGIRQASLALRVPHSTLYRMLNGKRMNPKTKDKVASALRSLLPEEAEVDGLPSEFSELASMGPERLALAAEKEKARVMCLGRLADGLGVKTRRAVFGILRGEPQGEIAKVLGVAEKTVSAFRDKGLRRLWALGSRSAV